ncbi:glycosyltransferase family 4 protein [Zavarzinella formosa]|uniref:glycosyltransferase family 4 protein n=1 Tax=Zavarzinella formosa TaxID=360055 RepID=UPI000301D18E|nr:glycosyltransferase family 4 protein [Zavarzinella formosa]
MQKRIAVVQHGNLPSARRSRESGEPESYYGMYYSQGYLDNWMAPHPHLVISLNGERQCSQHGLGRIVTIPEPIRKLPVPHTTQTLFWMSQICQEILRFNPTHLLLRANDLPAVGILRLAARKNWSTLVMFAGFFRREKRYDRLVTRELVRMLNRPHVVRVGNHREPATKSMIDAGLNPRKAVAWDYVVTRTPAQYPVRALPKGPVRLFMAGNLIARKGVPELIDAAILLRQQGINARLVIGGTSEIIEELKQRAAPLGEAAEFLGLVSNDRVMEEMIRATFVVVPTRPEFPEGFPMTFTESLTVRTPVIASTHPVFTSALSDGEGVRFFKAGNAQCLAELVTSLVREPDVYRELSEKTQTAFERLQCPTRFHEIIEDWLPTGKR